MNLRFDSSFDESEVYCRHRSGNFWRMRAYLGLACFLFSLSSFACLFSVSVTSVSLPLLMSRRGLFDTNQRLPSPPSKKTTHKIRPKAFSQCDSTKSSDSIQPTYIKLTSDVCLPQLQPPAFLVRAQCPRIAGFMRAQRAQVLLRCGFVGATLLAAFLVTFVLRDWLVAGK